MGIDPGLKESGYVVWDSRNQKVISHGISPNDDLLIMIRRPWEYPIDALAVEMIASYGMPVGKDIFETCLFIGRLQEVWFHVYPVQPMKLILKRDVRLHFCNSARAKDGNISQALMDRFGAKGKKSSPGVLYGIKKHIWPALACAVYYSDTQKEGL